ncbi:hypothetical protein GWI61_14090 [Proteus sp. G2667]|uniref:hypothetical protein n=1 Tax=Proteus sp. G2667 TaxID=2698880 RepID=UPI0013785F10|nr:hypothetical protein [Proteus sp. G2667]NBM59729.1 hypothetical protein [Proteus sp. G2667]
MKERGIIFNAEMVRAILDGRKTQTRRIVKNVMPDNGIWLKKPTKTRSGATTHVLDAPKHNLCPLGKVGDRLWVRETFKTGVCTESTIAYKATHKPSDLEEGWYEEIKWTPSIHMPRRYSRITLEIINIRVERLNDISQSDAIAEGAPPSHPTIDAISRECGFPDFSRSWFGQTWWHIYGKKNWQDNPWVWVIEFKRI